MTDPNHIEVLRLHAQELRSGLNGLHPLEVAAQLRVAEAIEAALSARASAGEGVCDCIASRCLHEITCASLTTPASPATGDWFADALTATGEAVPMDAELPGMWERADLIGGATDAAPQPQDHIADADKMVTPPAHGDGEGVKDAGPWVLGSDGDCTIYSEDFDHDVALSISGDFADVDERRSYAEWLCATLNTRPSPEAQEARDAARYRWLRDSKDLDGPQITTWDKTIGEPMYPSPTLADSLIDAALALPAQGEGCHD